MSAASTTGSKIRWGGGAMVLLGLCAAAGPAAAQSAGERPSWQQVSRSTQAQLGNRKGYQPGDLIHQKDVTGVLKALRQIGWQPRDQKRLLSDTLPETDALVRILSTRQGAVFMRKVKDETLIYDRMDRVCRVSGGQRMLTDIARLPDGQKLARQKRPHGVPGFLDLLPKTSSGKVRSIKDYGKPTGRIYTEALLLDRLQASYEGKSPPARGASR